MLRLTLFALLAIALPAHAAPPELLPVEEALTVAFVARIDGAREAFLVVAVSEDDLSGIALGSADAFAALAALSEVEIAALLSDGPRTKIALGELLPVIEGAQHIAGGANYAAHGAEVDVAAPFLFPKIAGPTPWSAPLSAQPGWLLDYEVELAVVFDRELARPADLDGARAGVFLINDFTERAQLTREADLTTPGVGRGFADAKGKAGFLPTGPFLAIPRDWRAFIRACEIRLHVNGGERQRAHGGELIWDVDELVRRALALGARPLFRHEGRTLAIAPSGIPRGTAILTGTPGGVVFRAPGSGFIAANMAWWLGSFAFFEDDAETFVKRRWIKELRRDGAFLRAGDVVIAEARGLGAIVTHITAP